MSLTTIQVSRSTKKKLEQHKLHPRETYESVLRRVVREERVPPLDELFARGDRIPQKRHTPQEIVAMIHEMRERQ